MNILMGHRQVRVPLMLDLLYIVAGVLLAVALSQSGLLDRILQTLGEGALPSFIIGIFFTSVFTIAPSSVAMAHLLETTSTTTVVVWGALGALSGDLILFFLIRDRFAEHLKQCFKPSFLSHLAHSFHFGFLKWLGPLLGAVIIASPLPDEFGLALMGLSRTRLIFFIPISFFMNMVGIYLLAGVISMF